MQTTEKRKVGRPTIHSDQKSVSITLRFTVQQAEKLRNLCNDANITLSKLVRAVLDSYSYDDLFQALAVSNAETKQIFAELKQATQDCYTASKQCNEAAARAGHARKIAMAYLKRTNV